MRLERARTALRQAEQALTELSPTETDAELFRGKLVAGLAMVVRVGSILDEESKGHRTPEFGMWWSSTSHDPMVEFVRDARHAVVKRGENRASLHHSFNIYDYAPASDERAANQVQLVPPSTHTSTWHFRGETYDGQEVVGLLQAHLAWIRDALIPEAERLTI